MSGDTIITISAADVDGMANQIARHEGFDPSDLPMLREAVVNWFEQIVQDTVTDREFAMRHFAYRWDPCLLRAQFNADKSAMEDRS